MRERPWTCCVRTKETRIVGLAAQCQLPNRKRDLRLAQFAKAYSRRKRQGILLVGKCRIAQRLLQQLLWSRGSGKRRICA